MNAPHHPTYDPFSLDFHMTANEHFRGHYDEWNERRVAFLETQFGRDWFRGKRVLELGCGHCFIGRALSRWGAHVVAVDGRQQHLQTIRQIAPHIETYQADLNCQWPLEGKFDIILNLGLLYHLEQIQFLLDRCFENADRVVLETEVLDTLEDSCLSIEEDKSLYDQSLTGKGIRPSAACLERYFDSAGFYAHRLASNLCNTTGEGLQHVYDWPCGETNKWQHGRRRLWVLHRKATLPAPAASNISVVVQGPVVGLNHRKPRNRLTQQCVASIRRALPQAEIIVSTWQGMTTDGLDCDQLVTSEDPGAVVCDDVYRVSNNVNRQIISTRAGVARVRRPYCLKVRSDLVLNSDEFLRHWGRYPLRQWSYKFAAERMLVSAIYSRQYAGKGKRTTRLPFHPSDFLFFGFREDVATLFDIPLAVEPETSRWFAKHKRGKVYDCYAHAHCRFFPEQHLWLSYVRKFVEVPWRDRLDLHNPALVHDRPSQVNNLVMLDQTQWSFELPKYMMRQYLLPDHDYNGLYRHEVWRSEYQLFCGGPPLEAPTHDSRMRQALVDSLAARWLGRVSPKLLRYLHQRVRKRRLWG
jgi:SAM-dependent methyltransferase